MTALGELRRRLEELRRTRRRFREARVPRLWVEPDRAADGVTTVGPIEWWSKTLDQIDGADREDRSLQPGDWTRDAVVYNMIIRTVTTFDHDGDGRIDPGSDDRPRETGTFVKGIALLPYIRSLGCNAVHLLPISAIGTDGRKGSFGSPYAVRNPYRLDESLAEPILGLGAEVEFGAFVEAAHRLGLRVVVEFALRTAAKDSDWAADHPDWFYWIREGGRFASPAFTEAELRDIEQRVGSGVRANLPPPSASYRSLFVHPGTLTDVAWDGARWIGRTADGTRARIPGAFADWPPDDVQPLWDDVTYLRVFDHPDFDYMAYNTLRMYDVRLARREHAVDDLWDCLAGVIPHYQSGFGIDGALIDMGHALPRELKGRIIREARSVDPGFAFWEEDFAPSDERTAEGYNAVMGNYWWAAHRPAVLRTTLLRGLSERGAPIPFFAAPETHNTPRSAARAGRAARSKLVWILGCFLPAVPFVHAGFELGEVEPVNTGLDFSPEEIRRHPPERLGLYNAIPLHWTRDTGIISAIRRVLAVRLEHLGTVADPSPGTLRVPECGDERVVCYVRIGRIGGLLVAGAFAGEGSVRVSIDVPFVDGVLVDLLSGRSHAVADGRIDLEISPWEAVVVAGRCDSRADAAGR
jgi:starch synthase (maltosyl-transferring)